MLSDDRTRVRRSLPSSQSWTLSALALALALASAAPAHAQDLPIDKQELKAFEALEKAMKAASKGQYDRAVSLYRRIAKLWPRTTSGVTARARSEKIAYLGSATLVRNGPSSNRLDIAIMGDGYRLGDQNDFDDQAKVIPKLFKKHKLYGEYYSYLNFHRINLRSKDQGVTGFGRTKETALGGHVSGTIQGHVAVVRSKVMNYLSQLKEQDGFTFAIVKAGSYGTGGRGIATIGGRADETAIHEWGHAFADLGDEYTGSTGHRGGGGRWPNLSRVKDAERVPWKHFLEKRIPGIGMYRGGNGQLKGYWRPTASGCVMNDGRKFCPVCREAYLLRLYEFVDPIDGHKPKQQRFRGRSAFHFHVEVLQPKSHRLSIAWYLLNASQKIRTKNPGPYKNRLLRGPLAKISVRPAKQLASCGKRIQSFSVFAKDLPAGSYQVVCRVQDRAKPKGQKHPWVLKDKKQLLWSERSWILDVPPK